MRAKFINDILLPKNLDKIIYDYQKEHPWMQLDKM